MTKSTWTSKIMERCPGPEKLCIDGPGAQNYEEIYLGIKNYRALNLGVRNYREKYLDIETVQRLT